MPSLDLGPIHEGLRHRLASLSTDIHVRNAPHQALARIQPDVAATFAEIDRLKLNDPAFDAHAASIRIADSAVIGLFHMGRVIVDTGATSMVAPLACIAIGAYPARPPMVGRGGLLLLLPFDAGVQSRGRAIADFMVDGLHELGVPLDALVKTIADLERDVPRFAPVVARRRLIEGRQDTFAELDRFAERAASRATQ